MKLAIEQLKAAIALTERELGDTKSRLALSTRQVEAEMAAVDALSARLGELHAAINVLRADRPLGVPPMPRPEAPPRPTDGELMRADLGGKKRQKPDALTSKG